MGLYIGLISGTSMDGVDAALARLENGRPLLLGALTQPYVPELRERLLAAGPQTSSEELLRLEGLTARAFANAALELLAAQDTEAGAVTAIGSHGQTLLHQPDAAPPGTLQIGDPNIIAQLTRIPVVADFRRADLASGGRGAPFAPLLHDCLLRQPGAARAVVNLGGMANLTLLPAAAEQPPLGFDTGPGNALLDGWCSRRRGLAMDREGRWAASGRADPALLEALLGDAYFAKPPPKSTGRDYFHLDWLQKHLERLPVAEPLTERAAADVQATLLELTAATVADAVHRHARGAREVLLCGGGVHNTALGEALRRRLPEYRLDSTARHGLDPDAAEALLFAWLAYRRWKKLAVELKPITGGATAALPGAVYLPPAS